MKCLSTGKLQYKIETKKRILIKVILKEINTKGFA